MADEQKRLTTAIYIRWSTDEQSDGTTLEVQREACLYFCKAKSWDVNDRYIFVDDGYSGGSLNRPAITELRQLVKSGLVQRVVVYKLDRLTRSVVDAVELVRKEWDGVCQVVSTQESFDTTSLVGRLLFDVLISFAEWERSTIRERTYSGKLKRAEQKRNPGIRFPFGYRKGSEGTFEIDKEEAVIVRRVFSDYLKGLGMLAIAQALNAEGIRTRRGFTWTNQRIRKMLTNPAYKGTLRYGATEALPLNRRRTEGKRFKLRERPLFEHEDVIPAIITVADWDRAQLVMQGRAEQHPKVLASQYLLSGLLKCGICGGPMSAYRNTGRSGKVYYYCVHQKQGWNKSCTQSNIPAELLEDAVYQLIKQDLSSEGVRRYVAGAQASYEQRVNDKELIVGRVKQDLANVTRTSKQLDEAFKQGEIAPRVYSAKTEELLDEQAALRSALQRHERELSALKAKKPDTSRIEELARGVDAWDELSLQQRQALLRSAIDVVEVVREKEFGADGRKKKWTSNPLTLTMHTRLYPSNIDAFYV